MTIFPRLLSMAVVLPCGLSVLQTTTALAAPAGTQRSLFVQSGQMPDEFRDHLFGVPLAVRVEKDGAYLGNAQVILGRDETVQLIGFDESHDSPLSEAERVRWHAALAEPVPLGICRTVCVPGLRAMHYSLENSLLSLLTSDSGSNGPEDRYLSVPARGSTGMSLGSTFNVNGGQRQAVAASYAAALQGSIGYWTTLGSYTYNHTSNIDGESRHFVTALHAQRELRGHYVRVGYFLPNFDGVTRQPRAPGTENTTSLGVMIGSSDELLASATTASLYPVYVTSAQRGVVEIHREGALISTQPVQPGMQEIDTVRLPTGIYSVELRVIEDGRETSREQATVHKPNSWRDTARRWRYSAFVGTQQGLLDASRDSESNKGSAGAVINHLIHPRAVIGATVRQVGERRGAGASLDWQAADAVKVSTHLYESTDAGHGVNVQGMFVHGNGLVVVSQARSWLEQRERIATAGMPPRWQVDGGWQDSSSLTASHRLGSDISLGARVASNRRFNAGTTVDLSFSRQQAIFGTLGNWRVSVFDRPGSVFSGQRRQRGVDFTMSLALGERENRYSGRFGTRSGNRGSTERYASGDVTRNLDSTWLRSASANIGADRYGIGAGGGLQFDHPKLDGLAQVQRSPGLGGLGGFFSLQSNVAMGDGAIAVVSGSQAHGDGTGMIVDLQSDVAGVRLRGDDNHGGGVLLRPGRNFIPVVAYRPGFVQFDFDGATAPAATVQPATAPYHLNRGGVTHVSVEVVSTFTVMGQVVDDTGTGLRGVHVINHAGRSVSQDEGFFTLELSSRYPTVELRLPGRLRCLLTLDPARYPREGDLVMLGGLRCPALPSSLEPDRIGAVP